MSHKDFAFGIWSRIENELASCEEQLARERAENTQSKKTLYWTGKRNGILDVKRTLEDLEEKCYRDIED